MKNFTQIIIALVLLLFLVVTVISDRLSARYVELQAQPMSAFDMAMESRTTAPAESGNGSAFWIGVALVAVFVLVIGGVILSMSNGGEFLRQLRLNRRKQRPRPSLTISNPQSSGLPELPTVPRLPAMRQVEEWQNE